MKRVSVRAVVALSLVIVAAIACSKDGAKYPRGGGALPPLFASVPNDTPYLMAAVEAVPIDYWIKFKTALEPMAGQLSERWRKEAENSKVFAAVLAELDGKWSQAGVESLGFSSQPRFALYGLGLQPVVLRLEVRDDKVARATIERIAARAGAQLPALETRGGKSYWKIASADSPTVVVAFADNQLIAAIGSAPEIDAKLGLILGIDKPAANMADGAVIGELTARHKLGPHAVGFADTRRFTRLGIEASGRAVSPACSAEIDRLGAKVPRVVFGGEFTTTQIAGGMIVELAPDVAASLQALKADVPGLDAALANRPVMALGGGLDLARGQQVVLGMTTSLQQLGTTCGLDSLVKVAGDAARGLGAQLPPPFAQVSGVAVSVRTLEFAGDVATSPMPEKLDAVVAVTSPDARALFATLTQMVPLLKGLGIVVDGKLHDVDSRRLPLPLPIQVATGVSDRAIVVAVGEKRAALGEPMLAARSGAKAPLLAMSYDYRALATLIPQEARADRDALGKEFVERVSAIFGQTSATVDITEHGVSMRSTVELK